MTSIASDHDIKVINCFHCNATLKVLSQKVEKKTKCPQCQTVFIPKDYLGKDSAESEDKTIEKKKSIAPKILLFLICCMAIASWFIFKNTEIKYDETLLSPSLHLESKNKKFKSLNENEIQEVLTSYKNPNLIPKGFDLPESTLEQARPTRSFLPSCQENADMLISKQSLNLQSLFTQENVVIFNNAYAKTNDPKYLSFLINEFVTIKNCTVDEMISFSEILKTQRESVSKTNLKSYVSTIDNIKSKTVELWDTKDPVQAISLLLLANSMPLESFKSEVLQKLKPVLEFAFKNLNESRTRKDGLFLLPEESTAFSLKLIKLAWFYHLEKKTMPEWLYNLAEKESCRLAYRLEQDGCLPVWQKDEKRISYTEEIYKASIVFDRDDLRYIGYSGWRLSNSYPPKQKKFDFRENGLFIIKSQWNHTHSQNTTSSDVKMPIPDTLQITYNMNLNLMSVSIGTLTQLLLKTSKVYNSINELDDSYEFNYTLESKSYNYVLDFENSQLELIDISSFYLIEKNDEITAQKIFYFKDDYKQLKNTFQIQILKNGDDKIKKITFFTRKKE